MAPLNERRVQAAGDGVWFYHGNIASPVSGGFVPNPLHFNRPCHSPRRGALVAVQNSGWGKFAFDSTRWTDCGREADFTTLRLSLYRKRANTPCSCLRLASSRFRYNTKTFVVTNPWARADKPLGTCR
jgi:hypothetical protein